MDENDEFGIVLHVVEGIALNFKCEQVLVTASLDGNKQETNAMPAALSIQFNNILIWETDKRSIKKMKAENLPIKVECFSSTIANGQEFRSLIGYILVPIRGIQIAPQKKAIQAKPHWYKLVGLDTEWRCQKPELLLLVTIMDKCNLDADRGILKLHNTTVDDVESIQIAPDNTTDMLTSQSGLFIKLLQDDGLLQVGDMDTNCDIFIAKLMFKKARNFEHIGNPEDSVNRLFQLHYNLLGSPTHCPLVPKGNGLYLIQEKIAIHFRSSLKSLKEYFDRVLCIPIELYYDDTLVGKTRFTFTDLLKIENLQNFIALYGNNENTMEIEGSFMIETLSDRPPTTSKPSVEFNFSIKYLSSSNVSNQTTNIDTSLASECVDKKAGGDIYNQSFPELPPTVEVYRKPLESRRKSMSVRNETTRSIRGRDPFATRSEPAIQNNTDKSNFDTLLKEKSESRPARNVQRTFSFNLILQTVKFTRRPDVGIWQISLHHPKSETTFTIANVELTEIYSNTIDFQDLELQLFFASTTDDIFELIECEPCVLTINGPRGLHVTADLDNEMLLVGTKQKQSGVLLMEDQTGEKIARADIFVNLDDLGLSFNSQMKRFSGLSAQQPRAYMDENLAYKIVEELEDWKLKQQETFLVELKRKENNHLAQLTAEWQKKRYEQDHVLAEKLDECARLTAALDEAHKTLKENGSHQLEQQRDTSQIKAEFERTYSEQLFEIREKAQRIAEDMAHKLELEQLKYRELEISKNLIVQENEKLKDTMNELEAKIEDIKQSCMSREQLSGVFQELKTLSKRFEQVEKSKNFYKDQWAKIIREVHKIKYDNTQQTLKSKRTRSMGLNDLLTSEHEQLVSEREELNLIRDALCSDDDSGEETMR